jgi:hypothetical protein
VAPKLLKLLHKESLLQVKPELSRGSVTCGYLSSEQVFNKRTRNPLDFVTSFTSGVGCPSLQFKDPELEIGSGK